MNEKKRLPLYCAAFKRVIVSGVNINDGNNGANYKVRYVENTTSTIVPAPLTVTANDADRRYDGTPFAGGNGFFYAGLVPGDTSGVVAGSPVYSGSAQGVVQPGRHVIAVNGLTAANYVIRYADGTLTIVDSNPGTAYQAAVVSTSHARPRLARLQQRAEAPERLGQPGSRRRFSRASGRLRDAHRRWRHALADRLGVQRQAGFSLTGRASRSPHN